MRNQGYYQRPRGGYRRQTMRQGSYYSRGSRSYGPPARRYGRGRPYLTRFGSNRGVYRRSPLRRGYMRYRTGGRIW